MTPETVDMLRAARRFLDALMYEPVPRRAPLEPPAPDDAEDDTEEDDNRWLT